MGAVLRAGGFPDQFFCKELKFSGLRCRGGAFRTIPGGVVGGFRDGEEDDKVAVGSGDFVGSHRKRSGKALRSFASHWLTGEPPNTVNFARNRAG